ncbi:MAG TPA: condensation domain-containing protein, partial [Thermoanaerobaculia bacterium]|nr:condensation domain-containing protein [Thermoanaerobaculia bacterium]
PRPWGVRDGSEGDIPLSFAQERLWLVDQLSPGNAAYNIPLAVRLRGDLDPAALAQALEEVACRHETLRTTFRAAADRPVQVIAAEPDFALPLADLAALPADARQEEALRLFAREASRPFDLARGPVFRALLLHLGEREHLCVVNLHHIAGDGWSLGVLIREVGALYDAFSQGLPSPLAPLPIQYADFALWQREWLRGEALERQIAFWRDALAGAPTRLDLPADRPRPALASLAGAGLPLSVPTDLAAALGDLARGQGATLFMTLLTAFSALLHRATGQDDLLVGSPVANRGATQVEGLIGFLINTLVLRARPTPERTFADLLSEVKTNALAAYAHQDLPFERLVEELEVERSLDRNPLFQVALSLQNAPVEVLALPGLSLEPLSVGTTTAKFDLSLSFGAAGDQLAGAIEYATDLFDRTTVERLGGHLLTLLSAAVADPERRLGDLQLLSAAERHQLSIEWNDTRDQGLDDLSLHEVFEVWAATAPERPAVVLDEERLTYGELDAQAGALARRLRHLGVGPESRVGIHAEAGLDTVVAMLAVLKAGGAWLPLDVSYPEERLQFMVEDAGVQVLLIQERLVPSFPAHRAQVVLLDGPRTADAALGTEDVSWRPDPENIAYIIYTSGSTGRPNGVMVRHHGAVRLARQAAADVERGSRGQGGPGLQHRRVEARRGSLEHVVAGGE